MQFKKLETNLLLILKTWLNIILNCIQDLCTLWNIPKIKCKQLYN